MGRSAAEPVRRASYGPRSPAVGERGSQTRQAILDAAIKTFQAQGVHAPGVEDIADAAGVSRATLYQYFASKDQIFAELADAAAGELLGVIRRPARLGPTAAGYAGLVRLLSDWAAVQDRYQALSLQWAVIDSPGAAPGPDVAGYIVAYVSALTTWLGPLVAADPSGAAASGPDAAELATVLLPLLFRVNDYRERGVDRGLPDAELLASVAAFVQLALFPSTPPGVIPARGVPVEVGAQAQDDPGETVPAPPEPPPTVRRILDAGAAVFAARGYHAASVQDVLTAAGAGRGTFYRHFDGKGDLLVQLSRACLADLLAQVGRFAAAARDPAGLRGWLAESFALYRRYRGVFRALVPERASHPELEELRAQSLATIFRSFDGALAGAVRGLDPQAGSLILLSLLERGPGYCFGTRYDLTDDRAVEIVAVLIERGLLGYFYKTGLDYAGD